MAKTSTYINFNRTTEEAFLFYKTVFGTEFDGGKIMRMGEVPPHEGQPELSEADKKLVMHVSLPLLGEHRLMGTDAPESLGMKLVQGNNVYINLEPDTREETSRLFAALSEGGEVEMPMQDMFWGDYFGSCKDKFGLCWMFNCSTKA
jgi:PhnB protein